MGRVQVFSQIAVLPFSAISTPRSVRLVDFDPSGTKYWDYLRISNRGHDSPVFIGLNGISAASTLSTAVSLPTSTNQQILYVGKEEVFEIYTRVSKLSIQSTGTAATIGITLGRF